MAFTSLWERSNHLTNLPWVIAGPILRKVTPKSVTVWVALKETALVTLSVKDDNNKEVAKGNRSTSAIGVNLHIVAVTARPTGEDLKEGIVYHYDFQFAGPHRAADLGGATNFVSLGYGTNPLPGFALPPSDLNSVRIFHGSCRMPHGDGPDALPLLDVLIEQAASNPTVRPHQLLLTGDQIYADDVSAALLMLLTDAGDTLLYGDPATAKKEILPVIGAPISTLPPYWRYIPLDNAGFTSDDRINHLVSLGEYLGMYLFTWSDVLWPPDGNSTALPAKEVVDQLVDSLDRAPPMVNTQFTYHPKREIDDHVKDVRNHYGTLFRVRRLLANIPTAMIFDDHEITDDWNMTLSFCRDIYNNQLARRVIQNGLVAYALCQHWGNVPEDFETATLPGATLLSLLDGKNGNDYGNNSTDIQKIVGVRTHPEQREADPNSFTYNYTIEAVAYQVIVTDTRSWRTFPDGNNTTGHFLPALPSNQLDAQVTRTPALNRRALLVVLTTNAPPTEPIRTAERNPWIAKHLSGGSTHADIYDAWDLPSVAFDRLLVALTEKLLDHGVRKGAVILLSGDVHHGFSARLKYRATKRFEDASPQPASVIFAELVASSFKKQSKSTIDLHKQGYAAAKVGHGYVPPYKKEGYVGYNLPAGTAVAERLEVLKLVFGGDSAIWKDIKLKSASPSVIPTVLMGHEGDNKRLNDEHDIRLIIKPPDFRYRLDYLEADKQGQQPVPPPSIPPFPPGMKREDAIKQFNQATNFYRDYNYKGISRQQIVGLNNIGEITFERSQSGLSFINHTLRWKREESVEFLWANYHIYVNPDDDVVYDDVKAENE